MEKNVPFSYQILCSKFEQRHKRQSNILIYAVLDILLGEEVEPLNLWSSPLNPVFNNSVSQCYSLTLMNNKDT
jgi:hypothetical protein